MTLHRYKVLINRCKSVVGVAVSTCIYWCMVKDNIQVVSYLRPPLHDYRHTEAQQIWWIWWWSNTRVQYQSCSVTCHWLLRTSEYEVVDVYITECLKFSMNIGKRSEASFTLPYFSLVSVSRLFVPAIVFYQKQRLSDSKLLGVYCWKKNGIIPARFY